MMLLRGPFRWWARMCARPSPIAPDRCPADVEEDRDNVFRPCASQTVASGWCPRHEQIHSGEPVLAIP